MTSKHDKYVIECWLQLYNRRNETTFKVDHCPDDDSSKANIDAVCRDNAGCLLAIEHTLIEPFGGEKEDGARLEGTLARLENHPDLVLPGYLVIASLPVGAIPTGVDWGQITDGLLKELTSVLPTLPEGDGIVKIPGSNWSVDLQISKLPMEQTDRGSFCVSRVWPGDPGPELVVRALERKVPKLSAFVGGKRILLLEQDAIAGSTESQFKQLPDDQRIKDLLGRIDEVWWTITVALKEADTKLFTGQLWPDIGINRCSLNLKTGRFWRVSG